MAPRDPEQNYAAVKAWRRANPDKVREQARRRYKRSPEKYAVASARYWDKHKDRLRPIAAERQRKRRRNDPEGQKRRMAKFKAKRRAEMEKLAGRPVPDVCEICNELNIRIVFDHCHAKGHFRGWICDRCNRVLGLIKDDAPLLRKLADYLEATDVKTNKQAAQCASIKRLCGAKSILPDSG